MERVVNSAIAAGVVPDALIRGVIRSLLRRRLKKEASLGKKATRRTEFVASLENSPLAVLPEAANEQHYEVPSDFYERVLGRNLKYSSALWSEGTATLDQAEDAMLSLYGERAHLQDGQRILELGCGWGSLSLWMARKFPNSQVTGISNSVTQKEFIYRKAKAAKISNLEILTVDMNLFNPEKTFDRIVSIEMFEHMRNWKLLFSRIADWLEPTGKLFFHIFCHRSLAYLFEARSQADWMAKYFFSGGMMPALDLPFNYQDKLILEKHWEVNGQHYAKTSAAWHHNLMKQKRELLDIFARTYGNSNARQSFARWKLFFLACEELFAYRDGDEWLVAHYLFSKRNG